jgi:hypothetical protein
MDIRIVTEEHLKNDHHVSDMFEWLPPGEIKHAVSTFLNASETTSDDNDLPHEVWTMNFGLGRNVWVKAD